MVKNVSSYIKLNYGKNIVFMSNYTVNIIK